MLGARLQICLKKGRGTLHVMDNGGKGGSGRTEQQHDLDCSAYRRQHALFSFNWTYFKRKKGVGADDVRSDSSAVKPMGMWGKRGNQCGIRCIPYHLLSDILLVEDSRRSLRVFSRTREDFFIFILEISGSEAAFLFYLPVSQHRRCPMPCGMHRALHLKPTDAEVLRTARRS